MQFNYVSLGNKSLFCTVFLLTYAVPGFFDGKTSTCYQLSTCYQQHLHKICNCMYLVDKNIATRLKYNCTWHWEGRTNMINCSMVNIYQN